jgi:hypothetical protein
MGELHLDVIKSKPLNTISDLGSIFRERARK